MNILVPDEQAVVREADPGDAILIPHTRTDPISFHNLQGEPDAPITISNRGLVRIDAQGNWVCIWLRNCQHVKLLGNGESDTRFGFELFGSSNRGLVAGHGSSNIELAHILVHSCDGAGIGARTRPCEAFRRTSFVQRNTDIHHCHIRDVGTEGMYIGGSHYESDPDEPALIGVRIWNNLIERTGWDGIQVGSAVADVEVHSNIVCHPAVKGQKYQSSGIMVNPGTTGRWHHNTIVSGPGPGFYLQGSHVHVYQNTIVRFTKAGIRWAHGNGVVQRNTILDIDGDGIKVGSGENNRNKFILDNRFAGISGDDVVANGATVINYTGEMVA